MLKYWKEKKKIPGITNESTALSTRAEEYDDMEIVDPLKLNIKEDCVTLSLYTNNIASLDLVK